MSAFDYDALQDLTMTIETEDEGSIDLELVTVFEYEDSDYAIFTEADDSDEGNAYIFTMSIEEDSEDEASVSFELVDDENLAQELFDIFQEIVESEDDSIIDLPDEEEDDYEDDDDGRWDEFITKKLH